MTTSEPSSALHFACAAQGDVPACRRIYLDRVDSTHDALKRRCAEGDEGPLWLFAGRQAKGRGRHGRRWVSEPGNLHASLMFRHDGDRGRIGALGRTAALALYDAIADLAAAAAPDLAIKWPNDLLCGGRKLAGVLIEILWEGDKAPLVLIGFGVNLTSHPSIDAAPPGPHSPAAWPRSASCLEAVDLKSASGCVVAPSEALTALSHRFHRRYASWRREKRIDGASYRLWRERCIGLGERIIVLPSAPDAPPETAVLLDVLPCGGAEIRCEDGSIRRLYAEETATLRDDRRSGDFPFERSRFPTAPACFENLPKTGKRG